VRRPIVEQLPDDIRAPLESQYLTDGFEGHDARVALDFQFRRPAEGFIALPFERRQALPLRLNKR